MAARKLLDAAAATGPSTTYANGLSDAQSAQFNITGGPTAVTVTIEGSLDQGVTWDAIATHAFTAGELSAGVASISIADKPRDLIRHNLTVLTGGTAPTVTSYHSKDRH